MRWINSLANIFGCTRLLAAFKLLKADQREVVRSTGEQAMQHEAKRAQVAAFFLMRRGGSLTVLDLVKFMYLSDRESLNRYGFPITWDRPYSLPLGPVPSETYNCIKAERGQCGVDWPKLISPRVGNDLRLVNKIDIDDLDELSEAEMKILEDVWAKFGRMTAIQLSDWTHHNCPEWTNPGRSSVPIQYEEIFKALGKPEEEIPALVQHINDQIKINSYLMPA